MLRDFAVDKSEVVDYEVIVAVYHYECYEGSAFVLLKKGHDYYEVNAYHCSCYGLEEKFDIEESAELALKRRYEEGQSYGSFRSPEVLDALKQHFRW